MKICTYRPQSFISLANHLIEFQASKEHWSHRSRTSRLNHHQLHTKLQKPDVSNCPIFVEWTLFNPSDRILNEPRCSILLVLQYVIFHFCLLSSHCPQIRPCSKAELDWLWSVCGRMSAQVRPEGSTNGWRRARSFDRPLRSRTRHTLLEEPF